MIDEIIFVLVHEVSSGDLPAYMGTIPYMVPVFAHEEKSLLIHWANVNLLPNDDEFMELTHFGSFVRRVDDGNHIYSIHECKFGGTAKEIEEKRK